MATGYVKLSNDFWRNTKVRKLARRNPEAVGIYALVLSYCGDALNDGFIREDDLLYQLNADEEHVAALCEVGLLERTEDGYAVHDWLKHQRSREQIEAKTEWERERKREWRESRKGNAPVPPVSQRDNDVSPAPVPPVSQTVDNNPEPRTHNPEKTSFFQSAHARGEKRTRCPTDFTPDDANRAHARRLGLDPDAEAARFRDWWRADGGVKADWQTVFRGWLDHNPDASAKPGRVQPSEAWIGRRVLERVPAERAFEARRMLFALLREGRDADEAAGLAVEAFTGTKPP